MTHAPTTTQTESPEGTPLKRVLGPKLLLLFIVGDILGAGVYAVTGDMAAQVGGIVWLPFIVAFAVAALTALSYLELVSRYPRAAGAALYAHKAFGVHFITFLVAFAVICSGITSASTSSDLLGANLLAGLDATVGAAGEDWITVPTSDNAALVASLGFILLLALINLRGVGESVKFNVVLTLIELLALAIVIVIGFYAMTQGGTDLGRLTTFESDGDTSFFIAVSIATAIAFFAQVGFEDSVNMVEETHEPERIFPRAMLGAIAIAAVIYVLVAIAVVAVLSFDEITAAADSDEGVLLSAVKAGASGFPAATIFPFLTVFAVANTALINMLMASRLLYGLARQGVLPRALGTVLPSRRTPWVSVLFTTALAVGLIYTVTRLSDDSVTALSGTTALLLLLVFSVVNISLVVVRHRDPDGQRSGFRAPMVTPFIAAAACLFLAGPWARLEEQQIQYKIAAALLGIGIVLWAITWAANRGSRDQQTGFRDVERLEG